MDLGEERDVLTLETSQTETNHRKFCGGKSRTPTRDPISALVFNKAAGDEACFLGIKRIQPYLTSRIDETPIESLAFGVGELDTHPGNGCICYSM